MILRFLRLFSAFRALEQDRDATVANLCESLQQMTTEKLLLQDRLDAVMEDRAKLWGMMERSIENERATLQMQVNFGTQQRFGITPFPEAVHLPPSAEPSAEKSAPFGRRMMPSEMVAQRTREFVRTYSERHKQPAAGPIPA